MDKLIWKKVGSVTAEYDGYIMVKKYKIIKVGKHYILFATHTVEGVEKFIPLQARFGTLKDAKNAMQKKLDLQKGI